jgi:large subunit ribosomal protein L9
MKVLLRQNVYNLGQIGDVVDVKPGYARNYLLPQGIGFQPTEANIKKVEEDKQRYLEELAKQRAEMEAKAAVVNDKEVTISARANEEGHLYGSVGPAQIVAALAEENVFIDEKNLVLAQPIRQLDKYDVEVRFNEEVSATVHVWVVPTHDSDARAEPDSQEETSEEPAGQSPAPEAPEVESAE